MNRGPVTQRWVNDLTFMQQSVLLSAIRGCDGLPKRHKSKALVKWYRRCILLSAFDGVALTDPFEPGGGSFTGPIAELPQDLFMSTRKEHDLKCSILQNISDDFVDSRDELPYHYTTHFMHAAEIVGYKHPDEQIREFWIEIYERLVKALHTWPETEAQMDKRLGDNMDGWVARNDRSTSCSD
jgi:hypothetical protein